MRLQELPAAVEATSVLRVEEVPDGAAVGLAKHPAGPHQGTVQPQLGDRDVEDVPARRSCCPVSSAPRAPVAQWIERRPPEPPAGCAGPRACGE
jgi:hypothetical protein